MRCDYIIKEWHLTLHALCLYYFSFSFLLYITPVSFCVSCEFFIWRYNCLCCAVHIHLRGVIFLLPLISEILCVIEWKRSDSAVIVDLQKASPRMEWALSHTAGERTICRGTRISTLLEREPYVGAPGCSSLQIVLHLGIKLGVLILLSSAHNYRYTEQVNFSVF